MCFNRVVDTLRNHHLYESILFSFFGIWQAIKTERNVKIELGFAVAAVFAGWFLGISKGEWLVLILIIFAVLSAEIFNSAIEGISNVVRDHDHLNYQATKQVRDLAAGAVMLLALGSIVIGLVIFLPYLFSLKF